MAVPVSAERDPLGGPPVAYDAELERLEIELLLEGVFRHYGFDFRSYAYASIRRRLWKRIEAEGLTLDLRAAGARAPRSATRWSGCCSISRSTSRRCSATRASTRCSASRSCRCCAPIRSSGSGTPAVRPGEEVYSMAILLEEEGLYDRARIYATDINDVVLQQARGGNLSARPDAGVHRELHPRRRQAVVLRVLHGEVRRRAVRSVAHAERRVLAAQPRHRPVVQRVQRHLLPQRADLLRRDAAEPRARAVLRQSRDVRRPRARQQGVAAVLAVRGVLREAASDARRSTGRCSDDRRGVRDRRRRHVVGRAGRAARAGRRPAARRSRCPSSSCSTGTSDSDHLLRDAAAGAHAARRVRGRGQDADRARATSTSRRPTITCSSSRATSRSSRTRRCATAGRRST